jgi:hypothetical protein
MAVGDSSGSTSGGAEWADRLVRRWDAAKIRVKKTEAGDMRARRVTGQARMEWNSGHEVRVWERSK